MKKVPPSDLDLLVDPLPEDVQAFLADATAPSPLTPPTQAALWTAIAQETGQTVTPQTSSAPGRLSFLDQHPVSSGNGPKMWWAVPVILLSVTVGAVGHKLVSQHRPATEASAQLPAMAIATAPTTTRPSVVPAVPPQSAAIDGVWYTHPVPTLHPCKDDSGEQSGRMFIRLAESAEPLELRAIRIAPVDNASGRRWDTRASGAGGIAVDVYRYAEDTVSRTLNPSCGAETLGPLKSLSNRSKNDRILRLDVPGLLVEDPRKAPTRYTLELETSAGTATFGPFTPGGREAEFFHRGGSRNNSAFYVGRDADRVGDVVASPNGKQDVHLRWYSPYPYRKLLSVTAEPVDENSSTFPTHFRWDSEDTDQRPLAFDVRDDGGSIVVDLYLEDDGSLASGGKLAVSFHFYEAGASSGWIFDVAESQRIGDGRNNTLPEVSASAQPDTRTFRARYLRTCADLLKSSGSPNATPNNARIVAMCAASGLLGTCRGDDRAVDSKWKNGECK